MTNRERIEENYEDALFAMWMNDFARRRGEQLLEENERLKNDPEAAVPETLQRKNLNLIYRELRRNSQHFAFKKVGKVFLQFAATVAIMAALFGAAYALSPEFRAGTLNVLMDLDERAASFQLVKDESAAPEISAFMPNVTVGWLPEGYNIGAPVYSRLQTTIDCPDANGDLIRVRVFTDAQSFAALDTEDADSFEDIMVNETPALMVTKEDVIRISWADKTTGTYVFVSSSSIDSDTIRQVAESVYVSW